MINRSITAQTPGQTGLNILPQAVTIRPARTIGPFQATVVVDETAQDDLEITQHPVQRGAQISDHAYKKPSTVTIKAAYTEADKGMPLDEIYKRLLAVQEQREPFDVVTGKRIYKNMLFKALGNTTDAANENILSITATLQEVIIVSVGQTIIPARAKQKYPGKTGATEKAGNKKAFLIAKARYDLENSPEYLARYGPETSALQKIKDSLGMGPGYTKK